MRIYVGVTDGEWFRFLAATKDVDEVNFWQPSPKSPLSNIQPGDLFLFKLKYPHNVIAGGGYFAYSTVMPIGYAWKAFEHKNGAPSFDMLRANIVRLRTQAQVRQDDFHIGCILLAQPFFFSEDEWFPAPKSWASNVVRGRYYEMDEPDGKYLWNAINYRLAGRQLDSLLVAGPKDEEAKRRWTLIRPGQGIFRSAVAASYNWKCSVTGERVVPALEAAHIKPFSKQGPNIVQNGLLLRADIHKLLDEDYVTVSPDFRFEVGKKLREDFENGRDYYALHGRQLTLPVRKVEWPDSEFIAWHNQRFRG
jgi:putative restriction endonuclease